MSVMQVGNSTAAATAPTGSNTVVLLNTFTQMGGQTLDPNGIGRYQALITHDRAFRIRVAWSDDGTAFDIFADQAVAIPTTPAVADLIDIACGGRYIQVTVLNGGTDQTLWRLHQSLVLNDRSSSA